MNSKILRAFLKLFSTIAHSSTVTYAFCREVFNCSTIVYVLKEFFVQELIKLTSLLRSSEFDGRNASCRTCENSSLHTIIINLGTA